MEKEYGEFIVKIIETLNKNGFPDKQVSLPLEKMYEYAHNKGLNFNKVLDFLEAKESISHTKTDEKIIFSKEVEKTATPKLDKDTLEEAFKVGEGMSGPMGAMFAKAKEMFGQMSPEQLQSMMSMVENMPESKKQEMMKKAKDMGFM